MMIIHEPFGQEHPYEQGAEERFPRQPLAGETFTIGIVIRPPQVITEVRVVSQLNDAPPQSQNAILQTNWQAKMEEGVGAELLERIERVEQDVWHARLIAPPVGQMLTYWIEAGDQTSTVYSLCGEAWQVDAAPQMHLAAHSNGWHLDFAHQPRKAEMALPDVLPAVQKVEWLTDGTHARRLRLTFTAAANEAFYGLGERFNALNQRGEVLDVRCYEQYKSQGKRTYMPIPFLLSSQGYGLYVESARWMQFDLTGTNVWTLEADLPADENLRLTWFMGNDPFAIVGNFTLYTGQPKLPPQWAFGLWMSGNEWNSQARVLHEVAQHEKHDIPVSALVIEAWSDETTFYIWNDAQYTPVAGDQALTHHDFTYQGRWTDPKGMVEALHEKGIRVLLWQVPVFKHIEDSHPQHEADRAYFEQERLGIRADANSLYRVRPFWFRQGYMLDVTNQQALEWWFKKRAYLLDEIGIDGFKTDGGEHLWGLNVQFADGRSGEELWNLYPKLYTEAYYNFATSKNSEALTFSRAGFTGSQVSPAHWAGDENSTWDAYRHSILAGLSAGMSGIIFWGWDLGGFSGEIPSAELYLRGAAMAAFCPIMQYHSEYNSHRIPSRDRTPWNIQERTGDERVIPIFRHFVKLRQKLMPYIWQEAEYAAQSGQPMMRALQVTEPQASPYQYLFGRDLLVCPVVEEGTTEMEVYLPVGTWRDLWTNRAVEGGCMITVPAPLDQIPVFVRAGAEIS